MTRRIAVLGVAALLATTLTARAQNPGLQNGNVEFGKALPSDWYSDFVMVGQGTLGLEASGTGSGYAGNGAAAGWHGRILGNCQLNENTALYGHLLAGDGAAGDEFLFCSMFGVNGAACQTACDVYVREAFLRMVAPNNKWEFEVGRIDFSLLFDRNAHAWNFRDRFIAPAFVNNVTIDWPTGPVMSAYFGLEIAEGTILRAGAATTDPTYSLSRGGFSIVELDQKLFEGAAIRGQVWSEGAERLRWGTALPTGKYATPFGVAVNAEFQFGPLGVFGRWGVRNEEIFEIASALSGGITYKMPGQEDALVGVAANVAQRSKKYLDATTPTPINAAYDKPEMQIEGFYHHVLPCGATMTYDIQMILVPFGDKDLDPVLVFGVLANVPLGAH